MSEESDSVIHTPECASGARAEKRGDCNCGAVEQRPYRVRTSYGGRDGYALDELGKRMVHVEVLRPLTTREAVEMSIAIQEFSRVEGERWSREQHRSKR